jgi:hypothetical protein
MTFIFPNESRQDYINRAADIHLFVAKSHHKIGNNRSMWLALLYWAMAESIYGEHWDKHENQAAEKVKASGV